MPIIPPVLRGGTCDLPDAPPIVQFLRSTFFYRERRQAYVAFVREASGL